MKVQLVVVRGKPEGKVIPLIGPKFKIGRGETCHLRPVSEQISREHAEFTIEGTSVFVRDLGSRNGTLVNGKALTEQYTLKDRDLVQVGPLTFAVSITEVAAPVAKPVAAPAAGAPAPMAAVAKAASPDDISSDDIDSWLIGPNAAAAEQPTTVYGGDTITIAAFKDAAASPKPAPPPSASDDEYERQTDETETAEQDVVSDQAEDEEQNEEEQENEDDDEADGEDEQPVEEFMDESNPFFAAKKAQKEQAKTGPTKPVYKDTSDAASDILRRLMERKRAERNS